MGYPPSRAIWTLQIFPQIFCAFFARLWKTYFSSATTSKKNLRTKNLRKNLRTKNLCQKPLRTLQKTVSHILIFWKMGARKNTQKKRQSAPNLRKTPAPRGLGAGERGSPVFLKPLQDLPAQHPTTLRTPWLPPLSLGQGGGEWESDRASAAEIPEPRL